jgi:hydrogenase expression/formation protein HypC
MCLAIPAKIKSIHNDSGVQGTPGFRSATVEISGVIYEASLMLTPEAKIGDYVILHAGFAIQILDQKEAEETLKLLEEISKTTQEVLMKRK